ncbi:MAG: alpha/beta fold hydrolase, partial [Candidatus Eisenbacteria sp.]|nr:alpha/beta fold hydrolase [Candidatus Eisenbacteria bacterium]
MVSRMAYRAARTEIKGVSPMRRARILWACATAIVLLCVPGILTQDPVAQEPSEFVGDWQGALEVSGTRLTIIIHLVHEKEKWSGTMDSPMQGATGIPLRLRVRGAEIEFSMDVPGNPVFKGKLEAGRIIGTFSQSGQSLPLTLSREKVVGPVRPQEPKRPFPYEEIEVSYANGDITLAGTLTLPSEGGPFPAALLISGSGAQDRDETVFAHKPFLVLSDNLTRRGIAVLRVDDRGVGGSTGGGTRPTTADFTEDALAGVRFLQQRPEVDPKKIGLIGHSEGGTIAPLAASRSDAIAFIVL